MASPWVPRVDAWEGQLPMRHFTPIDSTVGGTDTAAAGVPAAYLVRRDHILECIIRFYESEWPAVRAWIAYGQQHPNTLDVAPDRLNNNKGYLCYLESPRMGERFSPTRDSEAPNVYEITVQFRRVDKLPWALVWY